MRRPARRDAALRWVGARRGELNTPYGVSLHLAPRQAHQREGRPVLLVVVVEGIIPPRAVVLLKRQQHAGELVLELRLLVLRQLLDAVGRVVVAVEEEVAGHGEP